MLGDDGRVLVRYSGTEAKARVMIEGPDEGVIQGYADENRARHRRRLRRRLASPPIAVI